MALASSSDPAASVRSMYAGPTSIREMGQENAATSLPFSTSIPGASRRPRRTASGNPVRRDPPLIGETTAMGIRAESLLSEHRDTLARRIDHLFRGLFVFQWSAVLCLALLLSPRDGYAPGGVPVDVWLAGIGGGVLAVPSLLLTYLMPGAALTRNVVAVVQVLFGALVIHTTGGRSSSHFHIFGSLAVLAFYRDRTVLLTATFIVVAEHFVRAFVGPEAFYGVGAAGGGLASFYLALEHTGWILFEDLFLIASCADGQGEMRRTAERHAQLETQKDRVREASRAKSEFLANMSHEIRTPMSAVTGYADLLLDPALTASERVDYVQTIRRNGEHLLCVINDILDISKIEAGKMTVEHLACSPSRVVVDVASLMRVRAQEKGLDFQVRYVGEIPETVQTDPTRLRQIVMNLVSNSIKFTESGSVRIIARCEGLGTPHTRLIIEVADTGIGMSKEQVGGLFQAFTQGDSSMTRRFGGTGLGLAICKRLAALLGGDLSVNSSPGRGSSFTLVLNTGSLDGVTMLSGLKEASVAEPSVTIATRPTLGAGVSVLLAEDGLDNQRLIALHLRRAGATVKIVDNGRLAVEEALGARDLGQPYDVILMDMQMPELDGYGATAKLRLRGYTRPIVALTAHAMAGDRERCIGAGCDDYLTKPVTRDALVGLIARHAPKRGAELPPPPSSLGPIVSAFANDPDMAEIVVEFLTELPEQVAMLSQAAASGDLAFARRVAHQLKGSAGGYGFPAITEAAADIEDGIREQVTGETLRARVAALEALCRRTQAPAGSGR